MVFVDSWIIYYCRVKRGDWSWKKFGVCSDNQKLYDINNQSLSVCRDRKRILFGGQSKVKQKLLERKEDILLTKAIKTQCIEWIKKDIRYLMEKATKENSE